MRQTIPLFIIFFLLGVSLASGAEVTERFLIEPIFGTKVRIVEANRKCPRTLILLHGVGPEGAAIWADFIPEMALDYHVVACDLPGFGQSEKPNLLYSPERYSAFLDWLVNQTTTGRFILVGHSLGGALALHYAATAPLKPDQLILIDAAGILHRAALTKFMAQIHVLDDKFYLPSRPLAWFNRFTGTMIEKLQGFPLDIDLILRSETFREKMLQGDPNKIAGLALVETDFTELIDRAKTPTTLIWGEHDQVAPLRTGQMLAARLQQAELDIIPESGHTPMRQHPDLFRQSIRKALRTPPGPATKQTTTITDRIGRCNNQENAIFRGHYRKIELTNCQKVQLVDVTTGSLSITDSEVTIERSRIKGDGIGLQALRSRISATVLDIDAELPIRTDQSQFDFVGVTLKSRGDILVIGEGNPSRILFSVSRGISPQQSRSLHEVVAVSQQEPLKLTRNK